MTPCSRFVAMLRRLPDSPIGEPPPGLLGDGGLQLLTTAEAHPLLPAPPDFYDRTPKD